MAKDHAVIDLPDLRDRVAVFRDRRHAGDVLAGMLGAYRDSEALVLAVPAGGVPVAAAVARALGVPLDVCVVSKITLPWNTEAGYGAVAFDGSVALNEPLMESVGLTDRQVQEGIARTREKVAARVRRFRGDRPFPRLAGRPVILVDDGLASGFTLRVGLRALRSAGSDDLVLAVPTAHADAAAAVAREVETFYCANLRGGWRFAVADAYEEWHDVDEEEALAELGR